MPSEPRATRDLEREYTAGGSWPWASSQNALRTLPNAIDDVTQDFGDDIYERMLFDPQVSACTQVMKAGILENGPAISSAVSEKEDVNYDLAKMLADEAEDMFSDMDTPLDDVLWDLLDSLPFGNKVAEQVFQLGASKTDGKEIYRLWRLKVKPRNATAFVVDAFTNVIGLLAQLPGEPQPYQGSIMLPGDGPVENLLPKRKFAISTFRAKDSDPRGRSILRSAYEPWWRKRQVIPEYLKYISQFAGPSLVGTLAEDATPTPDPNDPTRTVSPVDIMMAALLAFRNGTAIVVPNGAEVTPIVMQGEGMAFLRALDNCDQQITKAVLTQSLATEEGKHMARAAAQVHQDVLGTLIRQGKRGVARVLRQQILRNWAIYNWGDEAARYAPLVSFGEADQQDIAQLMQGVAALANANYVHASQTPGIDKMLNLPPRDEAEFGPGATGTAGSADGQPQESVPPDRVGVRGHTRQRPNRQRDQQDQAPADQQQEDGEQ